MEISSKVTKKQKLSVSSNNTYRPRAGFFMQWFKIFALKNYKIVEVTPSNVATEGLFCSRDKSSAGFKAKQLWFETESNSGASIRIVRDDLGKQLAFIEFMPGKIAWRPVNADNYLFIQCMFVYSKSDRNQGIGTELIKICEAQAAIMGLDGVCTLASDGAWIHDNRMFVKNGYSVIQTKGRYELLVKSFNEDAKPPSLIDWEKHQSAFIGWHLVYANQCPWHAKAADVLVKVASEFGIDMQITILTKPEQIKSAPSGFGVFSLIKDGKLLEDHYISETRFRSILRKEHTKP